MDMLVWVLKWTVPHKRRIRRGHIRKGKESLSQARLQKLRHNKGISRHYDQKRYGLIQKPRYRACQTLVRGALSHATKSSADTLEYRYGPDTMLDAIISRLLNTFLGAFIERPSSDDIDVTALKGMVRLQNLNLRSDALDGLLFLVGFPWEAPLFIASGTISSVLIDIPLMSIGSKNAKIEVEGVDIVLGVRAGPAFEASPDNIRAPSADGCRRRAAALLSLFQSDGMIDRKIARVLANANVRVSNVRVTFQPPVLGGLGPAREPSPPPLCVTVETITATTTDGKWVPSFVSDVSSVHKVIALAGVTIMSNGAQLTPSPVSARALVSIISEVTLFYLAATVPVCPGWSRVDRAFACLCTSLSDLGEYLCAWHGLHMRKKLSAFYAFEAAARTLLSHDTASK